MQGPPSDSRNGYGILKISVQAKVMKVEFSLAWTKQKCTHRCLNKQKRVTSFNEMLELRGDAQDMKEIF